MAITDRKPGQRTTLVATYKKAQHKVLVLGDDATGLGFELDAGRSTGPLRSCLGSDERAGRNGWRFWSVEGEQPATSLQPKAHSSEVPKPRLREAEDVVEGIRPHESADRSLPRER